MSDDPFACFGNDEDGDDDDEDDGGNNDNDNDNDDKNNSSNKISMIKTANLHPASSILNPTTTNSNSNALSRGDDDKNSDDDNHATTTIPRGHRCRPRRDEESCGVLSFHHKTEYSLLMHVKNKLESLTAVSTVLTKQNCAGNDDDDDNRSAKTKAILAEIDEYCETRHWMMHVGPEKGAIVAQSLQTAIDRFLRPIATAIDIGINIDIDTRRRRRRRRSPFICVELGTYCGYASILLGHILRSNHNTNQRLQLPDSDSDGEGDGDRESNGSIDPDSPFDFHIYTLEIDPDFATIAQDIIQLAEMDDVISVLQTNNRLTTTSMMGEEDNVGKLIEDAIRNQIHRGIMVGGNGGTNDDGVRHREGDKDTGNSLISTTTTSTTAITKIPKIDFLFVDHDKDKYLPDVKSLEDAGLLQAGSVVVADNVTFAQIDDYVGYMKGLGRVGVVKTETREASVEYCSPGNAFVDGVEITTYLKTPITLSK